MSNINDSAPATGNTPRLPNSDCTEAANAIAQARQADLLLINAALIPEIDTRLIALCSERNRRENVILVLVTLGGKADVAYRIARCLQSKYSRFSLFVPGYCRSAGTLVALGAHELIISDYGELGPLDVLLFKKDELGEKQSGLIVMDALAQLQERAFESFKDFFMSIKLGSGLTATTSAEIASELSTGLYSAIYEQIDPLHLGEAGRAMKITQMYGSRLVQEGKNIESDGVRRLATSYPSHGFVIDRKEAENLFTNVRASDEHENQLAALLGSYSRAEAREGKILFLSDEINVRDLHQSDGETNPSGAGHASQEQEGNDLAKSAESLNSVLVQQEELEST